MSVAVLYHSCSSYDTFVQAALVYNDKCYIFSFRVSLKEKLSLGDVQNYLEKIRMKLECGVVQGSSNIPTSPLCHFMLPPEQVQDFVS